MNNRGGDIAIGCSPHDRNSLALKHGVEVNWVAGPDGHTVAMLYRRGELWAKITRTCTHELDSCMVQFGDGSTLHTPTKAEANHIVRDYLMHDVAHDWDVNCYAKRGMRHGS